MNVVIEWMDIGVWDVVLFTAIALFWGWAVYEKIKDH